MSLAAERRLGDRVARELYRDPDFIDDPVLADYLQGLWLPLLAAARARGDLPPDLDQRFAWQILLGRDRIVNAFAVPGGYLGVQLGLVAITTSRDELASVLAHELSHVTQRHISRLMTQEKKQAPWILGAILLGTLAARKSPDMAQAVVAGGQAAAIQGQLNFSRDMEREADRIGYAVATQAGFEPQGFVTMFEKLQQASRLNDNGSFPYLRTHPMTTDRMADMQARQQMAPRSAPAAAVSLEHTLAAARARVLSGSGVDALRSAAGEAQQPGLASQPAAKQAAAFYASAVAALKLRDFAQAQAHAARLDPLVRNDAPAARMVRLLQAEVALAAGDAPRASQALEPAGGSRAEVLLQAQAWVATGRAPEAAQRLQVWVADHPRDALAWERLSAAYAAQGERLRAIRAEAETRVAQLDYAAAVDRFKSAQSLAREMSRQRMGGSDHIEASIVDTRARQVESLLREQAAER